MRLTSEPTNNVYVDISSGEISEATVSPGLLTFDSSNWRSEQTVLVTGQDDNVSDGNQAFSIVLSDNSTSASEYLGLNPADVPVTNIDDESPGFMVSAISSTVTEEGGEAVFTVRLTSEPTAAVYAVSYTHLTLPTTLTV